MTKLSAPATSPPRQPAGPSKKNHPQPRRDRHGCPRPFARSLAPFVLPGGAVAMAASVGAYAVLHRWGATSGSTVQEQGRGVSRPVMR